MSSLDKLSEIVEVLLDVGRISFENGADTSHTIQTVLDFGESLGCDSVCAAPHYSSLSVTARIGDKDITRVAFMRPTGVNLSAILNLRHILSGREGKDFSSQFVKEELVRIRQANPPRGPLQISLLLAISCAAFCRLFGGDLAAMGTTLVVAFVSVHLRLAITKRKFNPYLTTFVVSLVASMLSELAGLSGWSETPEKAIVASILFLVPGVPLINAIEDIAKGYPIVGSGRLIHAFTLFVSIGIGLIVSARLMGISIL